MTDSDTPKQDQAEEQKRRYIEKWNETESPEIPDRGETSETPSSLWERPDMTAMLQGLFFL